MYVHTHTWHAASMCYTMILQTTLMHAACTMQGFFQNVDEEGAIAEYSDAMRGRYACGMIVVSIRGVWGYAPPVRFLVLCLIW